MSRSRAWIVAALVGTVGAAVVAAGQPGVAAAANASGAAPTTGTITGTLTLPAGTTGGGCIEAISPSQARWSTFVSGSGSYAIPNVAPGPVYVEFTDCQSATLADTWYPAAASILGAQTVEVTAGQTTGGIDLTVAPGGSISGTVTDTSGNPLQQICVTARLPGDSAQVPGGYAPLSSFMASTTTGTDGSYTISGLGNAGWLLQYRECGPALPGYLDTWSGGASSEAQAQPAPFTAGQDTANVDAKMSAAGEIAGVVDDPNANPAADVCVSAQPPGATGYDSLGENQSGSSNTTGTDGKFEIGDLATGSYQLSFTVDCGATPAVTGAADWVAPAYPGTVSVTAGQVSAADSEKFVQGGSISGTVDSSGGQALSGICADASQTGASGAGTGGGATTDTNGDYTIHGLLAGAYTASFRECDNQDWLAVTRSGQAQVTAGGDTSGIDQAMTLGGAITGTVKDPQGNPVADACAGLAPAAGQANPQVGAAPTGPDGAYVIHAVPAGTWHVGADVCTNTASAQPSDLVGQQYGTSQGPTAVTTSAGNTASGIDISLLSGGSVSGTVTATGTQSALAGVCVNGGSTSPDPLAWGYPFARTGADGSYTLHGLPVGGARISFYGCTTSTQDYVSQTAGGPNDPVNVAAGTDTPNVDAALVLGGSASGQLTVSTGQLPGGLCVALFSSSTAITAVSGVGSDGTWSAAGVPAGSYRVGYSSCSDTTSPVEWYKSKASYSAATPVTISAGQTTSGLADQYSTSVAQPGFPTASIKLSPTSGDVPLTVTGQLQAGDSSNAQLTYSVSWGDGSTPDQGSVASPYAPVALSHTYDQAGPFTVTATVTDLSGNSTPVTTVVSPSAVAPGAPGDVTGQAGDRSVMVSWKAPQSDGGSPITGYSVTATADGSSSPAATVTAAGDATSATLTGLTDGTAYQIAVAARNTAGTGPSATAAASVTPLDPTTTSVSVLPSPGVAGQPITFTATVAGAADNPAVPQGTVVFSSDGTSLGQSPVGAGGIATLTTSALPAGSHQITAAFTGAAAFAASTSQPVTESVTAPVAAGLTVTVVSATGTPVPDVAVAARGSDGVEHNATTGADGTTDIGGLADGDYTVQAGSQFWIEQGPVQATVANGSGSAKVVVTSGNIASATLTATRLSGSQIAAAGIDPTDPNNLTITEFIVHIDGVGDLCGYLGVDTVATATKAPAPDCSFVNQAGQDGVSGSGSTLEVLSEPTGASFLKDTFRLAMTIFDLGDPSLTFTGGSATLTVPTGTHLAATPIPQTATQTVADIPGGGSQSVSWIVEGDTEGEYNFDASYSATLDPLATPIQIQAVTAHPVHVWGASAMDLVVKTDSAVYAGLPYRAEIGIEDVADIPIYDARIALQAQSGTVQYIFQPAQTLIYTTPQINPGQTWWTGTFELLSPNTSPVDLSKSFVAVVGGQQPAATQVESQAPLYTPATVPAFTATGIQGGFQLDWAPIPGASSYSVYETPSPTTPFSAGPVATTGPTQTSVTLAASPGTKSSFAVSTNLGGTPTMIHPLETATVPQPPATGTNVGSNPNLRVAILGDSYISGEGLTDPNGTDAFGNPVSTYIDGTDQGGSYLHPGSPTNECHRSMASWAVDEAENLGAAYNHILFAACSGADSANVTSDAQYPDSPPSGGVLAGFAQGVTQLQDLETFQQGGPVDDVFLSIGGNDAPGGGDPGFANIIVNCLETGVSPLLGSCNPSLTGAARAKELDNIEGVLAHIRLAAPKARIFIAEYPDPLLNDPATSCSVFLDDVLLHNRSNIESFLSQLNGVIAEAANAEGAATLDLSGAFGGEGLCTSSGLVNELRWGKGQGFGTTTFQEYVGPVASESFHPTAAGHTVLYNYINKTIDQDLAGPAPTVLDTAQHLISSSPLVAQASFEDVNQAGMVIDYAAAQAQTIQVGTHSTYTPIADLAVTGGQPAVFNVVLPSGLAPGPHVLTITDVATGAVDAYILYDVAAAYPAQTAGVQALSGATVVPGLVPLTPGVPPNDGPGPYLPSPPTTVPPPAATAPGSSSCPSSAATSEPDAVGIAAVDVAGCPGYLVVDRAGRVDALGSAVWHGDLSKVHLDAPIVGITALPDGSGYLLVAADGGVFTFGRAGFYGSAGDLALRAPVVGITLTGDQRGYWLVAADGGVFSFGDARFAGSTGGLRLVQPVQALIPAPGGNGYWLVARDGGVFTFTRDGFFGSLGGRRLDAPIVGAFSSPDGNGYALVGADGGTFAFGDAGFQGSLAGSGIPAPIAAADPAPSGAATILVGTDGHVYTVGLRQA